MGTRDGTRGWLEQEVDLELEVKHDSLALVGIKVTARVLVEN